MNSKIILIFAFAAITIHSPIIAHSQDYEAEDTTRLMMEMTNDIGGHDAIRLNNGKNLPCTYRGTKKITITRNNGETDYKGIYLNCREKGITRDGIYEIALNGDEILSSSSRRSINGELFDAAMDGDAVEVRRFIKARADVNYTESISDTEGGYINEWSPLMSAVMSESLEVVKELISAGAWVNYMNSLAVNPIWIAANTGNHQIAKYLVEHGGYINNSNYEDITPLMTAAMNGHLEIARFLVASKAKINMVHKDGDTALMFALAKGYTDIARLLAESGADVNIRNRFGVSALHIAVAESNMEAVKLLIEHKADLSLKTEYGKKPLDIARDRKIDGIVKLLEDAELSGY